ncbi:MAG TPA: hypothetical protein VN934_03535 [Candidatus Tumulicola sp.]|nr:hypothetical protein [Candidatus Tumulicola sp.]
MRSHKVADLIAAYHKFIAVVGSGSDRCITFIAFTSKADVAVDMAPFDQQTDAKVNAMVAHRLMYVNNPGGEEWLETPNKADPQGYVIHRIRGK